MEPVAQDLFQDPDSLDLDLNTHDPFPFYAWLRQHHPLYWDPNNEIYVVSRYDDLVAVSRDPETFTSTLGNRPNLPEDTSLIHKDGREHIKRRRLVNPYFSRAGVEKLHVHIREITVGLIDAALARGGCDFVPDFASRLPMQIIAEILGYPREKQADITSWLDVFVQGGSGPQYVSDEVVDNYAEFAMYHEALVEERRAALGEDLLSVWLRAEIDGAPLDEQELLDEHTLILVGGSESTRNAISGGLEMLIEHPDQWEWLREHPEGIPNAVEEIIRWVSPFISMSRTVTRDVEMHGKTLRPDDQVLMVYPAANRDPRHFADPESFNIRREFTSRPLAFGHGPHLCLGMHLARLEVSVVLEELLQRVGRVDFAPSTERERSRSSFLHGLLHMPVVMAAR